MFFYQLSLKKALRFSPIFIFRFCRDNFVKLLKIRTVNLFLLPANSAFRMFAVKSEKNLQSNMMVLYRYHPNTIIFQTMKCVPSKKQILICIWFHTQLSPNKIKRTPITNCLSHVESILFTSRYFLLWDTFFCSERL